MTPSRSRRFTRLLLPCALAPMLETGLVAELGPRSGLALAPQVTALPPFDLFHDLRWISVYHESWILLALELLAMIGVRAVWVAWTVRAAWPGSDPPEVRRAAVRLLLYETIAATLMIPWVALLFGLALTHLSFLFFAAIPPALGIAVAIHRGAVSRAAGPGYRWGPTSASLGWVLGSFMWLSVAGAAAGSWSTGPAVAVAGLAGLGNARAWIGVVEDLAGAPHRASGRWVASSLVAATFAVVLVGTAAGFAADGSVSPPVRAGQTGTPMAATVHSVLVARGLFSRLGPSTPVLGAGLPPGTAVRAFSYRGLDEAGEPRPYGPSDTLRTPEAMARLMDRQVRALYRAYGRPVTIVAESEGALIARTYLLTRYPRHSGMVDELVTLGLAVGPTAVYFPPPGTQGWGVGSGWALRGLAGVLRGLGPLDFTPDAPILRRLTDCSSMFRRVVDERLPGGVRQVSIGALADAVDPSGENPAGPGWIVAAAHGGMVGRPDVQRLIADVLEGRAPPAGSVWGRTASTLVSATSAAWRVPSLLPQLRPSARCGTVR
ncbi:MAG TPA: hypothetical protein VE646_02310 [Actinomycetota bacterium]|nr:hypothetical protein [Actinomycetota bacterium]